MALADIGRALTGQALDTAKSTMLDAINAGADKKPSAPVATPASAYDSIGSVMLAQIQGMQ